MFQINYFVAKGIRFISGLALVHLIFTCVLLSLYLVFDDFTIINPLTRLKGSLILLPISMLVLWNPEILNESVSVDFLKNNSFEQQKESIHKQFPKSQKALKVVIGLCAIIIILSWLKYFQFNT